MSAPEPSNRPPPIKRLGILIWDLLRLIYWPIEAVCKICKWIGDEAKEMKKGWHLFLVIAVLIGLVFFWLGWEAEKYFERPVDDSKQKIIQWQPPEIPTNASSISILIGGNLDRFGKITSGTPLSFPMKFIEASTNGFVIPIGNYKPIVVRIIKNRLYLDLNVPTKTQPIEITEGKSTPFDDGWDWNGDSKEFEIVDDHFQSVFVETYVASNFVWVQGAIQAGGQVLILNTDFNTYALYPNDCVPAGRFNVADIGLTTDFVYPSTENFGKRIGQ
jgi:hypothetical protein